MIRHFLNPPNWFTSASIFCSSWALMLALAADPLTPRILTTACILVLFGAVFDLLDGRIARMTNRYSEFGVQLDSLADLISFGVAPALLAWAWALHQLGNLGALIAFWYILATAFRLARFNVNTARQTWTLAGHAQGLTSTMAGGCLVVFIWMANGYFADRLQIPAALIGSVVVLLGLLMLSSIPFRNFRDLRRNRTARGLLAFAAACCLTGAVVLDPSMWFGVGAALYLGLGLIDGLIVAVHQRHTLAMAELDEAEDDDAEEALAEDA